MKYVIRDMRSDDLKFNYIYLHLLIVLHIYITLKLKDLNVSQLNKEL